VSNRDEALSRLYAWVADRTARPDGSAWEHAQLRNAARELLALVRPVLTAEAEETTR
jgi:hypothetical protein